MSMKNTVKKLTATVGTLVMAFGISSCKSSQKYDDDGFFDYLYVEKESSSSYKSSYKNYGTSYKSSVTYKSSGREIKGSFDSGYRGKQSIPSYKQTKRKHKLP